MRLKLIETNIENFVLKLKTGDPMHKIYEPSQHKFWLFDSRFIYCKNLIFYKSTSFSIIDPCNTFKITICKRNLNLTI